MSRLTVAAWAAFALAGQEAEQLASATIDSEHLFLGLCKVEVFRGVTGHQPPGVNEADLRVFRQEVEVFVTALDVVGLSMVRARSRMRGLWQEAHPNGEAFSGHRTPRCRQVFSRSEAQCNGPISLAALMMAILDASLPLLDRLLSDLHVNREQLVAAMRGIVPTIPGTEPIGGQLHNSQPANIILQFGRDLTKLAKEGKLHPAIGRGEEIKRVARVLLQAKKGNPILVGEAGVGKTAIVEGLALKLLAPQAPAALHGIRLIELSLGALVAGTKYRGEFEERLQAIIHQCEVDKSIVLFIDEIHMLLGVGNGGGNMDAANLLKPALASGTLRCIGATTIDEYRKHIEKDTALERRFQVVWIEEPSWQATLDILEGLRPKLEDHHRVIITPEAIEKAIELSVRYLPDFRLPDKAIDLLDQACAHAMLLSFSEDMSYPSSGSDKSSSVRAIGSNDIAMVVAERCKVPAEQLTVEDSHRLLQMEQVLGQRVLGQSPAVNAVAESVRAAKAGIRDHQRPIGVFLFLGPTGTGKTELAKALAEFLFGDERRLVRIDMSEYSEKHSIAKLIGAPPGYIGHGDNGQLTDKVRNNPYSVVLFDEIEKAHPDIFDLFLQIFDEGCLTDSRGRRANFAETVIIMTSNLGSQSTKIEKKLPIGFAGDNRRLRTKASDEAMKQEGKAQESPNEIDQPRSEKYEQGFREAVAETLRPELRNRIQKEIVFYPLGRGAINQIIDKIIARVNRGISAKGIEIELAPSAREVLMERGFNAQFGVRAMERAIHDLVEEPLAHLILQERTVAGQRIQVLGESGIIKFDLGDFETR